MNVCAVRSSDRAVRSVKMGRRTLVSSGQSAGCKKEEAGIMHSTDSTCNSWSDLQHRKCDKSISMAMGGQEALSWPPCASSKLGWGEWTESSATSPHRLSSCAPPAIQPSLVPLESPLTSPSRWHLIPSLPSSNLNDSNLFLIFYLF